jgi:hypothetical protein
MSLTSKIIFVTSMLLCTALCIWVAVSFGGPGTTAMWCLAVSCIVVSAVVLLIKGPKQDSLPGFRVDGALEPTFRLARSELGAKNETWQLVLGSTQCTLIRPDRTNATSFARKWAPMAIRLPGFINGKYLGVVTEAWSPPRDDRAVNPGELMHAVKSIRSWDDRDTPYYWFAAPKELVGEIRGYFDRAADELGAEAAGPLQIKARRILLSGALGLAAGAAVLGFGIVAMAAPDRGDNDRRGRTIGLGVVLTLIGLWRLGQGIAVKREARRISQN